MAYPGSAMIEATNVSEGRGTEAPFLIFGAPWLDASALAARLEAFQVEFGAILSRQMEEAR